MDCKKHKNCKRIFSVTIDDCEIQTFRAGGKGGQNQNKRDSGVRIIHHPSGARGESREERGQLQNKRRAFEKMANSIDFRLWLTRVTTNRKTAEEQCELDMDPKNIKTEVLVDSKWVEVDL